MVRGRTGVPPVPAGEARRVGPGRRPVEPPPSKYLLPLPEHVMPEDELVCVGADLEPGTLLSAYRQGMFAMPDRERGVGWWSPHPRGLLPLTGLHEGRSLRASRRRFRVSVDRAFDAVVAACGDPARPHGWITPPIRWAYHQLHELGWAHSVEVWNTAGDLVGGVYGVQVGGLFAGESMFHLETDASKVALLTIRRLLATGPAPRVRLFDTQWLTPHLASLGGYELARGEYLRRLGPALELPPVDLVAAFEAAPEST